MKYRGSPNHLHRSAKRETCAKLKLNLAIVLENIRGGKVSHMEGMHHAREIQTVYFH